MPNRSGFKAFLILLLVSFVLPSPLYAGYVQKDRDGSKSYISDGKIKLVEPGTEGSFLILDYKAEKVTLVDGNRKVYATGAMDAYCQTMATMYEAFSEMESAFGDDEESAPESVKVVAAGKDTIAGMAADKYNVLVDGELYEEIWLASDSGLMNELGNPERIRKFMECLAETDDPVESSKAYQELSVKGWELRSISYEFGEKEYTTNIVEIKKASIPDSEFTAPGNYKKIKFEDFFMPGME